MIRSGRAYYAALAGTPHLSHPAPYYAQLAELRHVRKLALYRPTPQLASIVMYLPVLMALTYATWMRWGRGKMVGWLLLAMIIADGFLVWQPYNPTMRVTDILPEPGAIRFLRADKSVYRVAATGPILNPNTSTAFGIADIRGYDPMTPWRYVQLLRQIDGFYPIGNHHYFTHADASLLDLLNVKYLLTDQMPHERWTLVYEDHGPVKVYANQAVVPRAFIVHAAEVVSTPDEALARVTAPGFDFRRVVILEQDISYGPKATTLKSLASFRCESRDCTRQAAKAQRSKREKT